MSQPPAIEVLFQDLSRLQEDARTAVLALRTALISAAASKMAHAVTTTPDQENDEENRRAATDTARALAEKVRRTDEFLVDVLGVETTPEIWPSLLVAVLTAARGGA